MFGDTLKELRLEAGLLQEELAKCIGISANSISKYESNINEPSFDVLIRIANYFRCSLDYLLGITNIKLPPYIIENFKNKIDIVALNGIINMIRKHPENVNFMYSLLSFMEINDKL